jgi:hypothetical protein
MLALLERSHERVREEEGAGSESGVPDVGVRSGASIEVAHTYEREGDPREAVVTVAYRHLFSAAPSRPGPIARGEPLGEAGATGNAQDVHVHMEIDLRHDQLRASLPPQAFFGLAPQLGVRR